jgi:hypothetical protein
MIRPVSKSSYFLGDPPPDPRFLASLGVLSLVELAWFSFLGGQGGPVSKSSYFLGEPPPDPRLLASLGVLSSVELAWFSFLGGQSPLPPGGSVRSGLSNYAIVWRSLPAAAQGTSGFSFLLQSLRIVTAKRALGPSQGSEGALPVTARRAKRENGGLGEDPPGSTMTGALGTAPREKSLLRAESSSAVPNFFTKFFFFFFFRISSHEYIRVLYI